MYSVTYPAQPSSVVHNAHHQATMVTLESSIVHYVLIHLLLVMGKVPIKNKMKV